MMDIEAPIAVRKEFVEFGRENEWGYIYYPFA